MSYIALPETFRGVRTPKLWIQVVESMQPEFLYSHLRKITLEDISDDYMRTYTGPPRKYAEQIFRNEQTKSLWPWYSGCDGELAQVHIARVETGRGTW